MLLLSPAACCRSLPPYMDTSIRRILSLADTSYCYFLPPLVVVRYRRLLVLAATIVLLPLAPAC